LADAKSIPQNRKLFSYLLFGLTLIKLIFYKRNFLNGCLLVSWLGPTAEQPAA
jgi:hypothetical protein